MPNGKGKGAPAAGDPLKAATKPKGGAKSAASIDAVVQGVANVGDAKKGFKVLTVRCPGRPDAGMLKVIGNADVGDKVKVTVTKA